MLLFKKPTPLERLLQGYRTFRRKGFRKDRRLYQRLARKGQSPKVMVIACADSRVSPTAVLSAHPGDIFIARNIANIVPPYDPDAAPRSLGAAVEFAVKVLDVTDIVIFGHARCGGVRALVTNGRNLPQTDFLHQWVEIAEPARGLLPADFDQLPEAARMQASERAVLEVSVRNLLGYPWIRERIENAALAVHGWHFDMHDGALRVLDLRSGSFDPL